MLFEEFSTPVPTKQAAEYSEAELKGFKTAFAAQQKRQLTFAPLGCFIGISVISLCGIICERLGAKEEFGLIMIPMVLAGVFCLTYFSRDRCTACSHHLDRVGFYCPCCGKKALDLRFKDPKCLECGMILKWDPWLRSRPRMFRLHACSVCGVWLTDKGI